MALQTPPDARPKRGPPTTAGMARPLTQVGRTRFGVIRIPEKWPHAEKVSATEPCLQSTPPALNTSRMSSFVRVE